MVSERRGHNEGPITKRKDKDGNVISYHVRISIPGEGRKSFYVKTLR